MGWDRNRLTPSSRHFVEVLRQTELNCFCVLLNLVYDMVVFCVADPVLCVCVADFPQERCPVVLAPLLYPEKRDIPMDRILPDSGELAKTMMESSLAEFMQEVGYVFCAR